LKHLDKYLISEEATLEIEPLMMMHTTLESETLAEFHFLHREATIIRRVDRLGKPGFDLLSSKKQAEATHSREEFETMRLEAGTPIFGKDIDENRFVMEVANAARAVSYSKGCFPGQEPVVMSRDRAGGVSRFFVGLKVDGPVVPAGGKLVKDNQEVGIVTSCGYSPKLGGTLALGYVRKPHHERGTILDLHGLKAEVLGYPPCPG
jgi:folate-binding protein YgfZ